MVGIDENHRQINWALARMDLPIITLSFQVTGK